MVLKRTDLFVVVVVFFFFPERWTTDDDRNDNKIILLGAGVLGDGFGTFGDGVLGQFTGQEETYGGLNLPAGDGRTFVVVGEAGSFGGDTFEDVVHETVHDGHRLARDTGVGMYLFQHLVDVDSVALLPPALLLLVALRNVLLGLSGLLGGFTASLGWHLRIFDKSLTEQNATLRSVLDERIKISPRVRLLL